MPLCTGWFIKCCSLLSSSKHYRTLSANKQFGVFTAEDFPAVKLVAKLFSAAVKKKRKCVVVCKMIQVLYKQTPYNRQPTSGFTGLPLFIIIPMSLLRLAGLSDWMRPAKKLLIQLWEQLLSTSGNMSGCPWVLLAELTCSLHVCKGKEFAS